MHLSAILHRLVLIPCLTNRCMTTCTILISINVHIPISMYVQFYTQTQEHTTIGLWTMYEQCVHVCSVHWDLVFPIPVTRGNGIPLPTCDVLCSVQRSCQNMTIVYLYVAINLPPPPTHTQFICTAILYFQVYVNTKKPLYEGSTLCDQLMCPL